MFFILLVYYFNILYKKQGFPNFTRLVADLNWAALTKTKFVANCQSGIKIQLEFTGLLLEVVILCAYQNDAMTIWTKHD